MFSFKYQPVVSPEDDQAWTFDQRTAFDHATFGKVGTHHDDWKRDGSIVIPDVFGWWKETEIYELVLQEFDMYQWHFRQKVNDNLGWLRNMFYGLGQQLQRMDPVYYALYCSLRPNVE